MYNFVTFALKSLSGETVHKRSTVVTKCELHVVMNLKPVRDIDLKPRSRSLLPSFLETRTLGDDHLMTSLVHNTDTHLTLVTLLAKTPTTGVTKFLLLILYILTK